MMRRLIFAIITIALLLTACYDPQKAAQEKQEIAKKYNIEEYERVEREHISLPTVKNLVYFIDTRPDPDMCFAYLWEQEGGGENAVGGPSLTRVPCEPVENILYNKPLPPPPPPEPSCEQKLKEIESKQAPPESTIPELLQQ